MRWRLFGPIIVSVLGACLAAAAYAEPKVTPYSRAGVATQAVVEEAVGQRNLTMVSCNKDGKETDDKRAVDVRLQKSALETPGVIDAVLLEAAKFAWDQCSRPYISLYSGNPEAFVHYNVHRVRIFLPDGTTPITATLGDSPGAGDFPQEPGMFPYTWSVQDQYVLTHQRQAAADYEAGIQQRLRAQQEVRDQEHAKIWGWIRLFVLAVVAFWVWCQREKILYWYYSLTPHPAAALVNGAIDSGTELDAERFGRLAKIRGDNPVEKRVRADQVRALTDRWRKHERALRSEEAKLVQREVEAAKRTSERLKAEAALVEAAIAHELAATRVAALKEQGNA